MTIDPDRRIKATSESKGKREPAEDLENTGLKKTHKPEGGLIEAGPFKGLPLPLQKKDHTSLLPYVGCNEAGQKATLEALATHPSPIDPERRVHLGFSVWFNLDLMAVTKPSYGILCDFDNKIMDIYGGIGECLVKSSNPREFARYFEMFLNENCQQLFELPPTEIPKLFDIHRELTRPGSWIASEASFQVIKNLSQRGHLLFLNLDITDKDSFLQIAEWLHHNQLELDTLYTSNIIDWLKDELQQQAYILNLKTVSSPHTRFIQAYAPVMHRRGPKQEPTQHVTLGTDNIRLPPK